MPKAFFESIEPAAGSSFAFRRVRTTSFPFRWHVRDAIVALCRERGWRLLALHVRSNHVHVVVAADRDAGRTMSDIKAKASRALTRAGFGDAETKRWTRHGSTLHLFDETIVADKIDFTLNRQGTPMALYDGTTNEAM